MQNHDDVVKKLMKRPGVRAEVKRLEREETFEVSPEEEVMLVAALAEADRGESVPVFEVLDLLRKR